MWDNIGNFGYFYCIDIIEGEIYANDLALVRRRK